MRMNCLAILGLLLVIEVHSAPQSAKQTSELKDAPLKAGASTKEGKKERHGGIPQKPKGVGDWYCEEYCYDDGYEYDCVTDCYETWAPQSNSSGVGGVGGVRDQDQAVLNRVYAEIDKWRKAEGVKETILPNGLEDIVQTAGHIWKHSQHAKIDERANVWGKKYGLYTSGGIIACAEKGGCLEKYSNFDLKNPAQIWKDFRHKTGHYNAAVNPKNKYIACSADKQYQSRESANGWSIWCLFMAEK